MITSEEREKCVLASAFPHALPNSARLHKARSHVHMIIANTRMKLLVWQYNALCISEL